MAANVSILDGPYAGLSLGMEEPFKEQIGLGVSSNLQPEESKSPFALALYRLDPASGYRLYSIRRFDQQPFMIVFDDGPLKGERPSPEPIQILPIEHRVLLNAEGKIFSNSDSLCSVAVYEKSVRDGKLAYYLKEIDTSPEGLAAAMNEVNEQRLSQAINNFYESPNYDIYTKKPTGEHVQVLVQVGHRRAHVDERLVGVIEGVWRLGLDTLGSCQERPAGEKFAGKAYIGFPRVKDARRLEAILTGAGIECVCDPKKLRIGRKDDDGSLDKKIEFETANIVFASSEIDRVGKRLDVVSHT